ncbi:kinesin-like protein KIFC1 isoform X2 [Protopterus annectens]|nr:kinesin-like protein KIFC1 isoform X2 [Protopterus annectens]
MAGRSDDDKTVKANSNLPMLKKRILSDENIPQSAVKRLRDNGAASTRPKLATDIAGVWSCDGFYVGKTTRRHSDRIKEHFQAIRKAKRSFENIRLKISSSPPAKRSLENVRPKVTSATVVGVPTKATGRKPVPAVVPATVSKTALSVVVSKKRPGWDLKGQVADMQEKVSVYKGKMHYLTELNRSLQEELELVKSHLKNSKAEAFNAHQQISAKDLEVKTLLAVQQDLNTELQKSKTELLNVKLDRDNFFNVCNTQKEDLDGLRATKQNLSNLLELKEGQIQVTEANLSQAMHELEQLRIQVADLKAETARQADELCAQEMQRRKLHNIIQELKGNIRVFCRVRPLIGVEKEKYEQIEHISFQDDRSIILYKVEESHTGRERKEAVKYHFDFDCVFQPTATQEIIFEELSLLVQSALDGYHVCIFAYGQTGSGKTYTMEGPDIVTLDTMGMIPRAVGQIFKRVDELKNKGWKYSFTASFIEIYNETIRDLLVSKPEKNVEYEIKRVSQTSEELYVTNLKYKTVTSEEEVHRLLQIARTNRSVAKTAINDRSSRSHSVFQLKIVGRHEDRDLNASSVLSLVDLAGSERLDKSLSTGERLREAQAINTSLSTLGLVITSISNKESHIPFRNSKLTYLLQNSLGGNSKTLMFVNISPCEENFSESLNSLRFASKVNECVIGTAHANRR